MLVLNVRCYIFPPNWVISMNNIWLQHTFGSLLADQTDEGMSALFSFIHILDFSLRL